MVKLEIKIKIELNFAINKLLIFYKYDLFKMDVNTYTRSVSLRTQICLQSVCVN